MSVSIPEEGQVFLWDGEFLASEDEHVEEGLAGRVEGPVGGKRGSGTGWVVDVTVDPTGDLLQAREKDWDADK